MGVNYEVMYKWDVNAAGFSYMAARSAHLNDVLNKSYIFSWRLDRFVNVKTFFTIQSAI